MADGKTVAGNILVDTAWRSALSLTSPFVANHSLLAKVPKSVDAITGIGIGGSTVDSVARIAGLKLGRFAMENVVGEFSHAKAGVMSQDDFAGIIGTEILRRFRVIFDYPEHRMILEPNAAFSTPYEFDMSGLFITYEGAGAKAFKISEVIRDSPGANSGLQVGDLIEAVDQHSASSFTLPQIREMFKEGEGKEHRLSIRRGSKVLTVQLRLRRII
jgi:membrane-associated protease RseP (regulator of RpoE activity)